MTGRHVEAHRVSVARAALVAAKAKRADLNGSGAPVEAFVVADRQVTEAHVELERAQGWDGSPAEPGRHRGASRG